MCAQKGQEWCPSNQLLLSSWLSNKCLLNEWVTVECTSNLAVWMTESVCCTSETNTTLQISYTSLKLLKNLATWICWDITGYLRRKPALAQCLHPFGMGPLKMATLSSAEYMSYKIEISSQPSEPWEIALLSQATEFWHGLLQRADIWYKNCCCCLVSKSWQFPETPCMQPPRLLSSWDFPGKNIGVSCHFLLQGIFPTQGLDMCLLHCRQILYHWATQDFPLIQKSFSLIPYPPFMRQPEHFPAFL